MNGKISRELSLSSKLAMIPDQDNAVSYFSFLKFALYLLKRCINRRHVLNTVKPVLGGPHIKRTPAAFLPIFT